MAELKEMQAGLEDLEAAVQGALSGTTHQQSG